MPRDLGQLQLETLLSHTRLAVAATDATGRMTLYSPALQELLGSPVEGLAESGMVDHFDLYAVDGVTRLREEDVPLVRARRGEVVTDAVVVARRGGGDGIYLRCNAAPLRDGDGVISGAIVLVQDVTSEHAAQREQDVLRARLVETINHELRTPLTKVCGHAELLLEHCERLPEPGRRSVEVLARSAQDLFRLARMISALADLESHARLTKTFGDVAGLLRDTLRDAEPAAAARGIRLVRDLPDRLTATVDADELRRAVEAVLDNALRYAPDGTEVGVRLSTQGPDVLVEVWDEGEGVAVQDRARLVEAFERGDHPRQQVDGKGLGLAVAHTVVTAHGGALVLGDRAPSGLCVTLRLPRQASSGRSPRDATGDVSGGAGRQSG